MESLCRKCGVQRLALFGSALTAAFAAGKSDLDFLVEFKPMPPTEHAKAYLLLLKSLQDLFASEIDLVEPAALRNPYLRHEIEATQRTVYAA